MKKTVFLLIVLIGRFLGAAQVASDANGVRWIYTVSGTGVTLEPKDKNSLSGQVVVPDKIAGYTVRSIGSYAFQNCDDVTYVILPDTIVNIEGSAFSNCDKLTGITLNEGIEHIGNFAFANCGSLASVKIPDSVEEIGYQCFWGCKSLNCIRIPPRVTAIGEGAFVMVSSFSLDGGNTAYVMNDGVLYGNNRQKVVACESSKIGKIQLFTGVNEISMFAFCGCKHITDIIIPATVVTIEDHAFSSCTGLDQLVIPGSVRSFGHQVFAGCSNLKSLIYDSCESELRIPSLYAKWPVILHDTFDSLPIDFKLVVVGASREWLPYDPDYEDFVDLPVRYDNRMPDGGPYSTLVDGKVMMYKVESGVSMIGDGDVRCVSQDVSGVISFPAKLGGCDVGEISAKAFYACTNLTSVSLPTDLELLGASSFAGCSCLTTVVLNTKLESIGNSSFWGCVGLKSVQMPEGVTNIDDFAFVFCQNITSVVLNAKLENVGAHSFDSCTKLESIVLPDSVTSIGDSAFCYCRNMSSVMLSPNCDCLPSCCFFGCTMLSSINIPSCVDRIETQAFDGSCLTNVLFEGNAPTLGQKSFPVSLTKIVVSRGSKGWVVDDEGKWHGMKVVYRDQESARFPDLGDRPTKEEITAALDGSVDQKTLENISDAETYNSYREWVGRLTDAEGRSVGAQIVRDCPNAWTSYALGQNTLLEKGLADEDLKVESFEPTTGNGAFDFTVSIKDVEIGSAAVKENLKRVFGLEGGTSLLPGGLSSDNVDITFGSPVDGKLKFTAGPNAENADAKAFFMKVKVLP